MRTWTGLFEAKPVLEDVLAKHGLPHDISVLNGNERLHLMLLEAF